MEMGESLCYNGTFGIIYKNGSLRLGKNLKRWGNGDVIGISLDFNQSTITFYLNQEYIGHYKLPNKSTKYYPMIHLESRGYDRYELMQ